MPEILSRIIRYLDFFAFFIPVFSEMAGQQNNTFPTGTERPGTPNVMRIAWRKFFVKINKLDKGI